MRIVTADQMRSIDKQTIEKVGIPGIVLMENAGRAVVQSIYSNFPDANRIAILVGKGNNGGDGLVIARHLMMSNASVIVFLFSSPDQFRGDAQKNLSIVQNLEIPIKEINSKTNLNQIKTSLTEADLIVDSIFGIGLCGGVHGHIGEIIEVVNEANTPILAVDIPSGLNADNGRVEGACICANMTFTIGLPKRGLLTYPGAEIAGNLEIIPAHEVGFPESIIETHDVALNWTQHEDVERLLPDRPPNSHKTNYGRVFVVAGSTGMTGAAALASEAVLRVGAGLVTLGIPASLNLALEVKLTEVMTLPLPETDQGSIALAAESQIGEYVDRTKSVLAIGPGLSQHSETVELVNRLVSQHDKPLVVDADGLNAITQKPDTLKFLSSGSVLTPHPGEMSRLIGVPISEIEADRVNIAQQFVQDYQLVLVLKGAPSIVAGYDGQAWINSTGNTGMATAGSGDVLTGIIAGLIAQGIDSLDAAVLGVYLHGLAGDLASKSVGQHGMIAGDLLEYLPIAIEHLRG
ncbi:TPA: NAD(P)H-hydrate dehydratase [Candidatus Poribacteria bacterium]|nr:NAD(P)H-hydrate dehydratase [Candidatus Poribacteria bacterium]